MHALYMLDRRMEAACTQVGSERLGLQGPVQASSLVFNLHKPRVTRAFQFVELCRVWRLYGKAVPVKNSTIPSALKSERV